MGIVSKYLSKDPLTTPGRNLLLNIQALRGPQLCPDCSPNCASPVATERVETESLSKIKPTLMISANDVSRMVSHAIPSLDSVWPQKLLLFHTVISNPEISRQPMTALRNAKTIIAAAWLRYCGVLGARYGENCSPMTIYFPIFS